MASTGVPVIPETTNRLSPIGGVIKEKKVIFTITSLIELPKMKEMILSVDPDAFIVVNDTLEVLGKRHGKVRVY